MSTKTINELQDLQMKLIENNSDKQKTIQYGLAAMMLIAVSLLAFLTL